jgi:hypothetical protein
MELIKLEELDDDQVIEKVVLSDALTQSRIAPKRSEMWSNAIETIKLVQDGEHKVDDLELRERYLKIGR